MEKSDIIITKESNPEVLAICYAQGWCAHENFMTMKEAMAVTNIGEVFKANPIKNFDELRFFKNLTQLPFRSFYTCGKIETITVPDRVANIEQYSFRQSNDSSGNPFRLIIGSGCQKIGPLNIYTWTSKTKTIICKAIAPPILAANNGRIVSCDVYVPDDSVAAYQAAAQWSTAQSILPISQCPREYGEYQGLIKGNALDE